MSHLGDRITPLVDQQLPADATERAHAHLATCRECHDAVETERLTKARLATLGSPEPDDDLMRRLLLMAGPAGPMPPRAGHVPGTPRPHPVRPAVGSRPTGARPSLLSRSPVRGTGPSRPAGRRVERGGAPTRLNRSSRTRLTAAMVGALCLVSAGVAGGVVTGGGQRGRVVPPVDAFVVEHAHDDELDDLRRADLRVGNGGRTVSGRRMSAGSVVPVLLVLGLLLCEAALLPSPAVADARDDDAGALRALRRAVDAAGTLSYTGTQVRSAWPAGLPARTQLLRVRQDASGNRTTEGPGQGARSVSTLSDRELSIRALDALAAAYRLRPAGTGSVAGRYASIVVAERTGGALDGREAARFWLDDETGLLLREEVSAPDGTLFRLSAFLDVQPQRASAREPVSVPISAMAVTTGTPRRDVVARPDPSRWCASVPDCRRELPAGFVLLDGGPGAAPGGAAATRMIYGDGLSVISVFVQPGRLDADRIAGMHQVTGGAGFTRDGWPQVLTWQAGDHVITVVSDATPSDLKAALAALPTSEPAIESGAAATLRRGLGSVLDWLQGD